MLRWFRRIAFDWTCQYGIRLGGLAMTVLYFACMHEGTVGNLR